MTLTLKEQQTKKVELAEPTEKAHTPAFSDSVFDNLPTLARLPEVACSIGYSVHTLYAWRKKPELYHPPKDLFHKFGGKLYIRSKVLKRWFKERNK